MAISNSGIKVTPGSGATVATHGVGGASDATQYQVNMLANSSGQIVDSAPTYGLNIPQLKVGADIYHWEFFNHPSSAKTLTLRGIWPIPELSQTITGNVGLPRFEFYRTTAAASGGTASAAFESATTILANFFRMNPGDPSLSSHVSCRTRLTSITTGTFLWPQHVASMATTLIGGNAMMAVSALMQGINFIPQREFGQELVVPPGQGVACRQGTVASLGSVGWLLEFTQDP
jgi:hypothetical protein